MSDRIFIFRWFIPLKVKKGEKPKPYVLIRILQTPGEPLTTKQPMHQPEHPRICIALL